MSAKEIQVAKTVFRDELTPLTRLRYRILVPVANPATADDLLDLATSMARERKGEVVALHVVPTENGFPVEEERQSATARRTILEATVTGRRRTSVPIHTITRVARTVADGILQTAQENEFDLILLGWQGRMRPVSLGSSLGQVLDPVIKNAPCPVAVVKNPKPITVRHILVPTAGGGNAQLALTLALMLARRHRAEVTLLNITRNGDEEAGRRAIERTLQQVKPRQMVHQHIVVASHIVKGILREARDYDVVILGASREGIFHQILFGIVPEQVAKRCSKTVIMVKERPGPVVSGLRRLWANWSTLWLLNVARRFLGR